jgi:hypothetical protein
MVDQPVPQVTDEDVKRVVVREFGEANVPLVMSIIEEYGKEDWHLSRGRVRLAILKLAGGDLDRLLDQTQIAINDFRDVLAAAEYPRYMREVSFREVAEDAQRLIVEDDWRQYCEWLAKK